MDTSLPPYFPARPLTVATLRATEEIPFALKSKRDPFVGSASEIDPTPDLNDQETAPIMTTAPKIMTMRDLLELLSDDTWQKPPSYIDPAVKSVAKSKGWIETAGQTSGQRWHITPEGYAELERLRSGAPAADTEAFRVLDGTISLQDPALKPSGFEVLDFTAPSPEAVATMQTLNAQHLKKIKNLEKSLDDMGALADKLTKRIKELESAQTSSPDNVDALLDANRAEAFANILALAEEDGYNGPALDYVMWLRTSLQDARTPDDSPDWLACVITPLADIMFNDGSITLANGDILNDPSVIVRYVQMLRQSSRDIVTLADERANIIDQRDATIEALRREIDTLSSQLKVWQAELAAVKRHDLAVIILDDLCELLPEIERYRAGREEADAALEMLKAKKRA